MAEQDFIDFEALADMAPYQAPKPGASGPLPATESGFIDFEALGGIPQAGSTLAKHRWKRLDATASKGQHPTMAGDKTYEEMTAPAPATPLTDFEEGRSGGSQYGANQGLLTGVNTPPTAKGTEVPYTKQDIRNPLGRAAANLVPSAGNLIAAPVQIAGGLATHPMETAKELAAYMGRVAASAGKAGVWTLANNVSPALGMTLEANGIGPEQFVDIWAEDPIGVSLMMLGGAEGVRKGGKAMLGAADVLEGGPKTPQLGDFDEGHVPLSDPVQREAAGAQARMKAKEQNETPQGSPGPEQAARDAAYRKMAEDRATQDATARGEYVQERPPGEPILDSEGPGPLNKPGGVPRILDPNQRFRGRVPIGEERRSFMEPQPPRPGPLGSMLEPSRPIADFRNEYPLGYEAADMPRLAPRGETKFSEATLIGKRKPKVAGIRSIDKKIKAQFERLGIETKKPKKGKGGVTLGSGLGGAQDFLEKRAPGGTRQLIKDIVEEMKKGGLTLNDAVDEINRQKSTGAIDGPTESALLREVGNVYAEKVRGPAEPETGTYSEAAQADMAKFLDEQQKLEAAREAGKPKYEDISFKPAGVLNRPGKEPLRFFTADKDLPGPHPQKAGSKLNEEAIKAAGVVIPEGHKPFSGKLRVSEAPKEGFSFGPTKDPKGGTTLGSGLGGAQELFDNVSKIGLAHLQLGLTDFTSWAAAVRRDATAAGVHLTDDYLNKVWNSPTIMSANPRPPAHQAIAESIVNSNVQLSATKDVGPANTAAAQALLAPEVNTGPTSMQAMTAAENVLGLIRDIYQSDIGTKSGVDTWTRKYFPRFHEQATHFVTSGALAFLKARTHTAELRNIFAELPQKAGASFGSGAKAAKATVLRYMHDFSDLITDDRARALDVRNAAELDEMRAKLTAQHEEAVADGRLEDADAIQAKYDDLGPATHQMPRMDEARRAKLLADPKIDAAIKYWQRKIAPQFEQLTDDLNIQKRLTGPLGLYVKFKQLDTAAAKRLQRTRPLGEAPANLHPTESRIGGVSAPAPWGLRPGFSGSSKRASGKLREGMAYENDVRYMLENTYKDRLLATTKNDLRQAVRDAAITTKRTNGLKPIPLKVFVGEPGKGPNAGRWEPVVGITLESRFGPIQDTYYVPESIARTYKHAMETPNNTNFRKAVDLASSAATAQVIIMPAEAIRHGFNAITAVVNSRFMYKHGPLAEIGETLGAAATLGLSKMATALARAYKLEGPALSAAIEEYGSNGALRLSGYEGTHITPSLTLRLAEKVPGVRGLKDFVFGDPGSAKGLRGMETRLRIVLGEAIKELQPNLSNTEVAAKINDAYGTYVRKLEPQLTTLFKPLDPFARAGGGLTRSGYKLLTGRGVTGEYSPLIHSQVAGTLTAIAVYNFLLDDENKWPWEHKDYRAGDIMLLRRDDKTYRLSFADLANGLKRGAEFTGVTAVANALTRGERAPSVLTKEMIRGISNAYTNRLSPLIKGLNTLRTGKSMSESPSGDLYATAKPAMTSSKSSPMGQRFKAAAKGAIPVVPKLHELLKTSLNPIDPDNPHLQPSPEKLTPENYFAKVAYNLQDIFSVPYVPLIESGAKAERARGEVQNRIQQEWKDTTQSIAREAMNIPDEDKRMTYIMAEIEERISDELITELGNPMPAKAASFKSIISLIYRAPAYHFRAETLQGINQTPQTGVPTPP